MFRLVGLCPQSRVEHVLARARGDLLKTRTVTLTVDPMGHTVGSDEAVARPLLFVVETREAEAETVLIDEGRSPAEAVLLGEHRADGDSVKVLDHGFSIHTPQGSHNPIKPLPTAAGVFEVGHMARGVYTQTMVLNYCALDFNDPEYQDALRREDERDAAEMAEINANQGPDDADNWVPDNVARFMERYI